MENGKGAAFTSYDPVKDEEINQYNGASTAQIHAAVRAAAHAYKPLKSWILMHRPNREKNQISATPCHFPRIYE